MNYDDLYLLRLIKKLQERCAALETRLGSINTTVVEIGPIESLSYVYWEDAGPLPSSPPPTLDKVWTVMFRDGSVTKTWDPRDLVWR